MAEKPPSAAEMAASSGPPRGNEVTVELIAALALAWIELAKTIVRDDPDRRADLHRRLNLTCKSIAKSGNESAIKLLQSLIESTSDDA